MNTFRLLKHSFLICIFLLCLVRSGQAQHADFVAAERYYLDGKYFIAALFYGKVLKRDSSNSEATYQLAECYRLMFEYDKAEIYYKKIVYCCKDKYPYARFWYATMLKDNGECEKAVRQFKLYRQEHTEDELQVELYREKAAIEILGCEQKAYFDSLHPPRYGFKILPKPVNSSSNEFSPVVFKNDSSLILTSARTGAKGKKDNTFGEKMTDQYHFFKRPDTLWHMEHRSQHSDAFGLLNTKFNEVSGSITENLNKFYFTRCDEKIKVDINREEYNCAIYVSHFNNGVWGTPQRLNEQINAPGTWNSQPSVSPDGKLLFFVSKRPGGLGMQDIWYSTSNGDDRWEPPMNLGEQVNTLFMDMSPRYYADLGALFFSSNGHAGLGGLDVYVTQEKDGFSSIYNLGPPFNSNRDDMYFVLGDKKGFINSNREGGYGHYDVYTFDVPDRQLMGARLVQDEEAVDSLTSHIDMKMLDVPARKEKGYYEIQVSVLDSLGGKVIPNCNVVVQLKGGYQVASKIEDAEGIARFSHLPSNEPMEVWVYKEKAGRARPRREGAVQVKFVPDKVVLPGLKSDSGVVSKRFLFKEVPILLIEKDTLENLQTLDFKGRVWNKTENKPSVGLTISVVNEEGLVVLSVQTDENGFYYYEGFVPPRLMYYTIRFRNKVVEKEEFDVSECAVTYHYFQSLPDADRSVIAEFNTRKVHPNANSFTTDGQLFTGENSNGKPAQGLTILLLDDHGRTVKTTQTNEEGKFRFTNLDHGNYKVILQNAEDKKADRRIYFPKYVKLIPYQNSSSRKLYDYIFFDFNSDELRPEARKTLEEVGRFCKDKTEAQIELFAYTDSLGSIDYNKLLAARRGKRVSEYLTGLGVNPMSLVINAMGESQSMANNNTELGRQMNRRVELYVLGEPDFEPSTMTHIIEPKKTLYTLSKEFNISVEEMKELNGLTGNEIRAFTPVRVPRNGLTGHFTPEAMELRNLPSDSLSVLENQVKSKKPQVKPWLKDSVEFNRLLDSVTKSESQKALLSLDVLAGKADENIAFYIVQPGNTLHTIANLYGTTLPDIREINALAGDTIYVNQSIKIDFSRQLPNLPGYRVREGDTLFAIASRFGVSVEDLIEINNLEGYVLRKNMVLRLKR